MSSGSSILANGNTKTDLSTRAPFADPIPPADKPSGLLKQPNPQVNLPLGMGTSAIGTSFSNADGQSIAFDKPTALTNKDLADLFNNGKPVVTEALANGTVKVVSDQSASSSTLTNTNSTTGTAAPYTAGYSQAIADDRRLGLVQPSANPGLVPIPKELLDPASDTKSSLIPLAPFITPSAQTGKDATGITFTDDRGQTITLDNSTTLSAQTLANLFNGGNSVVAQTQPNGDVSLVDSGKQAIQNAYDALRDLVFKDPAPAPAPQPVQPPTKTPNPLNGNGGDRVTAPVKDIPQSTSVTQVNPSNPVKPLDWLNTQINNAKTGLKDNLPKVNNWVGDVINSGKKIIVDPIAGLLGINSNTTNPKQGIASQPKIQTTNANSNTPSNFDWNKIIDDPHAGEMLTTAKTIKDSADYWGNAITQSAPYQIFTGAAGDAAKYHAQDFANGNFWSIVPGIAATLGDAEHLPTTVGIVATAGIGSSALATKPVQAVLTNPWVLSALALNTGLNGGQVITGQDLQGNELSGTDRFIKGASVALDLVGLGSLPNSTINVPKVIAQGGNAVTKVLPKTVVNFGNQLGTNLKTAKEALKVVFNPEELGLLPGTRLVTATDGVTPNSGVTNIPLSNNSVNKPPQPGVLFSKDPNLLPNQPNPTQLNSQNPVQPTSNLGAIDDTNVPNRLFREDGSAIPYGFNGIDEYNSFTSTLKSNLPKDTEALFQGSSVTGKKFTTGEPFDAGRTSDLDIALAGDSLFQQAKNLGYKAKDGTRIGPLDDTQLKDLGLRPLAEQLSREAGRPVNFMLYDTVNSAYKRGSILVF